MAVQLAAYRLRGEQTEKELQKPHNMEVMNRVIEEAAAMIDVGIREPGFSDDDYAHTHTELNIPNTITISHMVRALKSHSASVIFREIPRFRKLYPRGVFGADSTATTAWVLSARL